LVEDIVVVKGGRECLNRRGGRPIYRKSEKRSALQRKPDGRGKRFIQEKGREQDARTRDTRTGKTINNKGAGGRNRQAEGGEENGARI